MARNYAKLTRQSIRTMRPGDVARERGIIVECLPSGDVRWSINVMVDGQRIHRVIGLEKDGVTRTQAEDFIADARAKAREGRLSLPRARKTHVNFAEAADNYFQQEREGGGRNLGPKERHFRLHLKPYFGSSRLDQISEFALKKFKKQKLDAGLSLATVNRILATYRHFVRSYAIKHVNRPLPMIPLQKEENERDYVLSPKEEKRLLESALCDFNTYAWLFIKCGLASALRHREILSISFDHFDHERRRVGVPVKGGRWRWQPITKELADIVARERDMAQDQDGWLFPSPVTESGHAESMGKIMRRCVIRAQLDPTKVIPHTLRHTAITRFANTEPRPTIKTLMAFSGHRSLQAAMRYLHATDQDVNAVLDRMEHAHSDSVGREQNKVLPLKKL